MTTPKGSRYSVTQSRTEPMPHSSGTESLLSQASLFQKCQSDRRERKASQHRGSISTGISGNCPPNATKVHERMCVSSGRHRPQPCGERKLYVPIRKASKAREADCSRDDSAGHSKDRQAAKKRRRRIQVTSTGLPSPPSASPGATPYRAQAPSSLSRNVNRPVLQQERHRPGPRR